MTSANWFIHNLIITELTVEHIPRTLHLHPACSTCICTEMCHNKLNKNIILTTFTYILLCCAHEQKTQGVWLIDMVNRNAVSNDSKHNRANFLTISTVWLCLRVAQVCACACGLIMCVVHTLYSSDSRSPNFINFSTESLPVEYQSSRIRKQPSTSSIQLYL